MIIPIDEKHQIASDAYQWMIQEKEVSPKGDIRWRGIKFYPTIEGAINGLFQLKLRLSDVQTLTDALAEAKNIARKLQEALCPYFEVTERGK